MATEYARIALTNLIAGAVQVLGHQHPAVILADAALHYRSIEEHNSRAMEEAHRNLEEVIDSTMAPIPAHMRGDAAKVPPFPKLGKIEIRVDRVYGVLTTYPVCERAKLIAEIAGTKTIKSGTLALAERLGFEIVTVDTSSKRLLENGQ